MNNSSRKSQLKSKKNKTSQLIEDLGRINFDDSYNKNT